MEKFTSIEQFRNVVKTIKNYFNQIDSPHLIPTYTFIGTVKLHGTNVGVRRFHGKFYPQSRERILDITSDNYGFAAFVASLGEETLNKIFDQIGAHEDDDITIYGEWIGKSIQDTVAISQLPGRQWVIFAVKKNGKYESDLLKMLDVTDFHQIGVNNKFGVYNIYEISTYEVIVNFKTPETSVAEFEKYTIEVEEQCPWGKKFDITGIGEGIVWTCKDRPSDENLWFKTKGTKHSKSKVKTIVPVDIEHINNIRACVDIVLSEGRLKQGLEWLLVQEKLEFIPENVGKFLKWVANDIIKEEYDTITENGFEWKHVVKEINTRSREWYFAKMNKEF